MMLRAPPWTTPELELLLDELEELLLELELDEELLEEAFPLLELDDELDEDEEELEDALPLLELEEDDELLLELEEDVPPLIVRDVIVGRPLPLPQKPNESVPPLAAMTWL